MIDWDNAPEGATHWCVHYRKWLFHDTEEVSSCCIPRPTEPKWDGYVDADDDPQEWDGEGFPEKGVVLEAYVLAGTKRQGRPSDKWIAGVSEGKAIGSNGGWGLIFKDELGRRHYIEAETHCRPIPTKAQRDRDELADLIANNIHIEMQDGNFNVEVGDAVDAAIDAGWTKP